MEPYPSRRRADNEMPSPTADPPLPDEILEDSFLRLDDAADHEMASPTADPPLPDEILEDIFLRLDDAADLAHASAACTSFRRVVSARRFLRRFRSLHRPPILGCLATQYPKFLPVDPPHRLASAAAALARTAEFDFSFINPRNNWKVRDVRDSRVLLSPADGFYLPPFKYLVVCDPLHRRYLTVPPVPGDLLRPTSRLRVMDVEPFLDPAIIKVEEEEGDLPVRVICNLLYESKVLALVFSSDTGKWQQAATTFACYDYAPPFVRCYAHGRFYWTNCVRKDVLVLDPREMRFSAINIPSGLRECGEVAIVEWSQGRQAWLAFFWL